MQAQSQRVSQKSVTLMESQVVGAFILCHTPSSSPTRVQSASPVSCICETYVSCESVFGAASRGAEVRPVPANNSIVDDTAFNDYDCEGLMVKMVRENHNDETRAVWGWLAGIQQAACSGFLKQAVFTIKDGSEDLVEAWTFNVRYAQGQEPTFDSVDVAGASGQKSFSLGAPMSHQQLTKAVKAMIRSVLLSCQVMQPLPEDRSLTIHLCYHDHTPDDYEPRGFRAASDSDRVAFTEAPLSVDMGSFTSPHHSLRVRLRCRKELFGDEEEEEPSLARAADHVPWKQRQIELEGDGKSVSDVVTGRHTLARLTPKATEQPNTREKAIDWINSTTASITAQGLSQGIGLSHAVDAKRILEGLAADGIIQRSGRGWKRAQARKWRIAQTLDCADSQLEPPATRLRQRSKRSTSTRPVFQGMN